MTLCTHSHLKNVVQSRKVGSLVAFLVFLLPKQLWLHECDKRQTYFQHKPTKNSRIYFTGGGIHCDVCLPWRWSVTSKIPSMKLVVLRPSFKRLRLGQQLGKRQTFLRCAWRPRFNQTRYTRKARSSIISRRCIFFTLKVGLWRHKRPTRRVQQPRGFFQTVWFF